MPLKSYVLKSEFILVALCRLRWGPGGQAASAVAQGRDNQSLGKGSGDGEKEDEIL